MLLTLYNNLLILVIIMLAGALLTRLGYIDQRLRQGMNRLLFAFTLPILVFQSMQNTINSELLASSIFPLAFGAGLAVMNGVVGFLLGRLLRTEREARPLLAFMNMFGNNIYLALPIITALFGPEGTPLVLLYALGSDLIFWTIGVALLARQRSLSRHDLKNLLNPTLVALVLGALAGLLGLPLPGALSQAMSQMGGLTTPLALMLTGSSLVELRLSDRSGIKESVALLIGKLLISPALAAAVVTLLGLEGMLAQALVIMASMPTIVRSIVLSDRYGWDSRKTALGVLVTTVACFVTIPLVMSLITR
jgi:hypothetical protein